MEEGSKKAKEKGRNVDVEEGSPRKKREDGREGGRERGRRDRRRGERGKKQTEKGSE